MPGKKDCFDPFNKNDGTKICFFLICFAPWQETFADAGDVDGGGPFRTMLIQKGILKYVLFKLFEK